MAARPVVDGIERENKATLTVIHLNAQDAAAREIAARFRLEFTPTFVFLDANGEELWRTVGAVDPLLVRRQLSQP